MSHTTLDAISKELAGMLQPQTVAMTLGQFITYCKNQIEKARAESDPSLRIEALVKAVSIAKAENWEETGATAMIPVFKEPGMSADAEKIAEHPGMGLGTGQQASPGQGAFEAPLNSPNGPASNTAAPAERIVPPAMPQSTPAAGAQGWMAKAAAVLQKNNSPEGLALLGELQAMLDAEPKLPGDAPANVTKSDDGWPLDLATPTFLDGTAATKNEDDFGTDPGGLARGKAIG